MTPDLLRVCRALLIALGVAAILKCALIDLRIMSATSNTSVFAVLGASIKYVLTYGLALAIPAVIATEIIRLRQAAVHIALGTLLALIAAYLSTRGETLTSPVFSGGALGSAFVLVIGSLSSLTYWVLAGHRAGWRGYEVERADTMATDAFRRASANAHVEYCSECLLGWSALTVLLFLLLSWISIDVSGLRRSLIATTEVHGNAVLKNTGHEWATFKIDGDHGVIEGLAPDEVQKHAAHDSVREALDSVTGFPGILAQIENEAVARLPIAVSAQRLADVALRENERKVSIEAERIAAEAARAAEAGTESTPDKHAPAAAEEARRRAAPPAAEPIPATAIGTREGAEARAGFETRPQLDYDVGVRSPALEPVSHAVGGSCTPQDLALIESSAILFDVQRFDIVPSADAEVGRLAKSARACAPRPLLVTGHADTNDDSLFNRALALQRAEAIREALVARGVPSTLVQARSAGTSSRITNGTTDEERALNRRAEFRSLEGHEISRDATLGPEERAVTCESDLAEIMESSIIHFARASAEVGAENIGLIKKLANSIQNCGSVIVTVEGHADKVGSAWFNQGLSEARANAVREALVAAGTNPTRLASRGFGSSRPFDPAETTQAFALNRRIEFKVTGKFTSTVAGGP